MSDDDKAAVLDAVRFYVRAGFYNADEITAIVDEAVLEPGKADQNWLRGVISDAFGQKRQEERTWPQETDCDRLDQLFIALNNHGIIALQNAGYTQSDGFSDIMDAYHDAGGEHSEATGYCFYHGQDLERAVESGDLWLAFGDIEGDDDKAVEVGRCIRSAAELRGFTVEWNGSIKTRLLIKGINWMRRSRGTT